MENLKDYAERLTEDFTRTTTPEYRKEKGQYFTPKLTSDFMVRQFDNLTNREKLKILDPCAGVGIFESAICDYLLSQEKKVGTSFHLYEIDENLIKYLRRNMKKCKEVMMSYGFEMTYKIYKKDFILSNACYFSNDDSFNYDRDGYDVVISNPPYYKLRKESSHAIAMNSLIQGQPNIYPLFMALSARLVRDNGEMTFLTPRSYCGGSYFKVFRKWFFEHIIPSKIHVFESRDEIFKKHNVLQEILILKAIKSLDATEKIIITKSVGENYEIDDLETRFFNYHDIILKSPDDVIVRIPTSEIDMQLVENFKKFKFNVKTLEYKVSTGKVVPFRATDHLLEDTSIEQNYVPLIWMQNIKNGEITWPIPIKNKKIALKFNDKSKNLFVSKKILVLVKRLSSKEGKQRINAAVLLRKNIKFEYIGLENHVNYIYKTGEELSEQEAYGLMALLNSEIYNKYFQMTNGSTQVNASEILNLPMPSIEKIKEIGKEILQQKEAYNEKILNEIVQKKLNINLTKE